MDIEFSLIQSVGFSIVVLIIGMWLKRRIYFFERFAIPSPVIGGFLFAIINLILRQTGLANITFDVTVQSFFMVIFFTSVGYGASIKVLKKAGPKVMVFLVLCTVLCFFQDLVAVLLAPLVGDHVPQGGEIGGVHGHLGAHPSAQGGVGRLVGAQRGEQLDRGAVLGIPVALVAVARLGLVHVHRLVLVPRPWSVTPRHLASVPRGGGATVRVKGMTFRRSRRILAGGSITEEESIMVALTPIITRSIDAARGSGTGFHSEGVVRRATLQQTILSLTEGTQLTEHESEVPASIYVLHGAIRVEAPEPFVIQQGELHELPELRRKVVAVEDTVLLLSAAVAEGLEGALHDYVLAPDLSEE